MTAPGGLVRGAVVPPPEHVEVVCHQLGELGLKPMSDVVHDAFVGHTVGEPHPGHPCLELIRVLALKAPCCHLIKPAMFDAVQVTSAVSGRERSRRRFIVSTKIPIILRVW